MTPVSNISASIHQRLLNKAVAERRPFNEILQYYAIERFLIRLGQSPYCQNIAEKFQAMVDLGMVNSRLKDFYDLRFMASSMEFDFDQLMKAITNTFQNRGTLISKSTPPALTEEFAALKQIQWVSFLKKSLIVDAPASLYDVIRGITKFITPLVNPNGEEFSRWTPTAGWIK